MRRAALALCLLGLAACRAPAPDVAPGLALLSRAEADEAAAGHAVLAQLAAAYEHALGNGDPALAAQLHATGALLIGPDGEAARGRAAVADALARLYPEPQPVAVVSSEIGVAASGDLAYVVAATADARGPGTSVSVLHKTPEGWRVVVSTWSRATP